MHRVLRPAVASRSRSTASADRPRATGPRSSATAATRRVCRSSMPGVTIRSCSTSARGCATSASSTPATCRSAASCLLSHLHWDHIQGLPFFTPLLQDGAEVEIYAPAQQDGITVEQVFAETIKPPLFPIHYGMLPGNVYFHEIVDGDVRHRRGPGDRPLDPPHRAYARLPLDLAGGVGRLPQRSPDAARRFVERDGRRDRVVCRRRSRDPRCPVHRRRVRAQAGLGPLHDRLRGLARGATPAPAGWRCSTTTRRTTTT